MLELSISAAAGMAVHAAKVGERSAPITGRPPTQPSCCRAVNFLVLGQKLLLSAGKSLDSTASIEFASELFIIELICLVAGGCRAESQFNGTAAAEEPADGADRQALLDKAILLQHGNTFNFDFLLEIWQLSTATLVGSRSCEGHVDGAVASK